MTGWWPRSNQQAPKNRCEGSAGHAVLCCRLAGLWERCWFSALFVYTAAFTTAEVGNSIVKDCSSVSYESVGSTSSSLLDRVKVRDQAAWQRLVRVCGHFGFDLVAAPASCTRIALMSAKRFPRRWSSSGVEPMAFKMVCPHCKKILNVTEKAFGRTVPCPGCNQPLAIPQDPESLPPLRPVKTSSSQQEDIKATFRGSGTTGDRIKKKLNQGINVVKKKPWILAPVGGGILLALLLATWLIVDGSSGPAKPKQWQTVEFDPFHQPTSPSHRPLPHQPSDAEGLAACSGCAGFAVLVPVVIIAIIVLHIALLVWVARDAKGRGMDIRRVMDDFGNGDRSAWFDNLHFFPTTRKLA